LSGQEAEVGKIACSIFGDTSHVLGTSVFLDYVVDVCVCVYTYCMSQLEVRMSEDPVKFK